MFRLLAISVLVATTFAFAHTQEVSKSGAVEGVVLDGDKKPLPGATVYALPEENMANQLRTTTDAAGKFRLADVPVGMAYIDAYKESDGYPYNFFSFFLSPGEKTPNKVPVTARGTTFGVVIQLGARAAHLQLEITSEDGEEVQSSLLFDRPDMPGPYSRGARSKESLMVPPVPFRLTVEADGYKPWHYGGENWHGEEGLIALKSGETLKLSVRLKRQGSPR